jgi:hypothetical protein
MDRQIPSERKALEWLLALGLASVFLAFCIIDWIIAAVKSAFAALRWLAAQIWAKVGPIG